MASYSDYTNIVNATTYHAEVGTYIAGLTTPLSTAQKVLLNTFTSSLKTGLSITNLSDFFDTFWLWGGETAESSLKNFIKNAHHGTPQSSPAFVQYEGYTSNGTSYINLNYNPSSQGVRFTLNDASVGVYSRTNSADVTKFMTGSYDGTNFCSFYASNNPGTGVQLRINTASTGAGLPLADISGLTIASRIDNTKIKIYNDSVPVSVGEVLYASSAIPNLVVGGLCINNAGSFSLNTTNQVAAIFYAKSCSQAQVTVITNALEAYMDGHGKGVA